MAHATREEYDAIVGDRPHKFDAAQVNFRQSVEGEHRCWECVHFYQRTRDGFTVCEIFRDDETDKFGVDAEGVCDFWTPDGAVFPLLKEDQ